MDAKHFRIGNYVQTIFSSLEYKRIKDSTGNYPIIPIKITSMGVDCDFKPIPLTEEWLLKLGLEYDRAEYYIKEDEYVNLLMFVNSKTKKIYHFADVERRQYQTTLEFKHVHQLQNLYFALTGKELTIKDKVII